MAAIGWIWAGLMLLSGMRLYLDRSVAPGLAWAMMLSGLLAMPLLWNRRHGLLGAIAPSRMVRAGLAIFVLLAAGWTFPDDALGLLPGIA